MANGVQPPRQYGGGPGGYGHSPVPPPYASSYDGRGMSPVDASRGGMRSDLYSAGPSRHPAGSYPGDIELARTGSPTPSNGSSRAVPASPIKSTSLDPTRNSSIGDIAATPVGPLAPLPASLFTPATSAEDLAAKLALAQKTLRELDARARLTAEQAETARRAAERKEDEQDKEIAVLRRELEAAKRTAVEIQIKANTQRRYGRVLCVSRSAGLACR